RPPCSWTGARSRSTRMRSPRARPRGRATRWGSTRTPGPDRPRTRWHFSSATWTPETTFLEAPMSEDRAAQTREHWLDTLARYKRDPDGPRAADYWAASVDCASRDELRAIQDAKLAALTPFLYENSTFYRRRFDRLSLLPTDLPPLGDLAEGPVRGKHRGVG